MFKTISGIGIAVVMFAVLIVSCQPGESPEWTKFKSCGTDKCVAEVIAVKDAFLKDPKGLLGQFNATYSKGEDHVIGWLYMLRDSVLANAKYGTIAQRQAMQQQIVAAAKPFENDATLGEMAKSVLQEIGDFAIMAEVEDGALITGTYGFELPKMEGSGTLKILAKDGNKFRYSLLVTGRAPAHNMAIMDGEGTMTDGSTAILENTEFGKCRIELRFKGDTVVVKTLEGDPASCGFGNGAMADGTFTREDDLDPFRAEGGDAVPEMLLGKWQSTIDPKAMVEITDTHYIDYYEGKEMSKELYSYHQKCPADCPDADGVTCIRVVGQDAMCFAVIKSEKKLLQLSLIGGTGKTLEFKRK
jgi:hypothetical protein